MFNKKQITELQKRHDDLYKAVEILTNEVTNKYKDVMRLKEICTLLLQINFNSAPSSITRLKNGERVISAADINEVFKNGK